MVVVRLVWLVRFGKELFAVGSTDGKVGRPACRRVGCSKGRAAATFLCGGGGRVRRLLPLPLAGLAGC